ncbi:MAG: acyl-CoA desaturase [Actinomycetia bacterium]|nr:acyl-CoA desaturase [Actinomycetes bacterium]
MTLIDDRRDVPEGDEKEIRRRLREDLPDDTFKPNSWRYGWFVLHQAIFWGGVVFVCTQRPALWVCAIVSVVMGVTLASQGFLAHEAMHGALGGPRWMRQAAGWIGLGPALIPPTFWARWHNTVHHGNTNNGDRDPDNYGTVARYEKKPGLAKFTTIAPGSGKWYSYLFLFYSFTFHAQLVLWMQGKHRREFKGMKRNLHIAQAFGCLAIWVAIGIWAGWLFAFVTIIPWAIYNFILQSYILTNHFMRPMAPTNNPLDNSMSVKEWGPADPVLFHFSHHVEHHLFPRMGSNKAPRVRAWLEENEGDRYVCPTHWAAVSMLYKTPRVFKDAHTLSDPFGNDEVDIEEIRLEMLGLTD